MIELHEEEDWSFLDDDFNEYEDRARGQREEIGLEEDWDD